MCWCDSISRIFHLDARKFRMLRTRIVAAAAAATSNSSTRRRRRLEFCVVETQCRLFHLDLRKRHRFSNGSRGDLCRTAALRSKQARFEVSLRLNILRLDRPSGSSFSRMVESSSRGRSNLTSRGASFLVSSADEMTLPTRRGALIGIVSL